MQSRSVTWVLLLVPTRCSLCCSSGRFCVLIRFRNVFWFRFPPGSSRTPSSVLSVRNQNNSPSLCWNLIRFPQIKAGRDWMKIWGFWFSGYCLRQRLPAATRRLNLIWRWALVIPVTGAFIALRVPHLVGAVIALCAARWRPDPVPRVLEASVGPEATIWWGPVLQRRVQETQTCSRTVQRLMSLSIFKVSKSAKQNASCIISISWRSKASMMTAGGNKIVS